jgi:hypothetical protein
MKKQLTASILKSDDLPEEILKASEGEEIDKWFWATVEVLDHDGDIVRVAGIDTTKYAQSGAPIKFISSHTTRPLDDGRLPIVGKAVKWMKTLHKTTGAPALAVGVKFAGTQLGKEMKELYEGSFLTDVSIGAEVLKHSPIKDGGNDYEEVAISELSACITGANQFAGVMRALAEEPITLTEPDQTKTGIDADFIKANHDALIAKLDDAITQITSHITNRLDDIEDSIAAKTEEGRQSSSRKSDQSIDLDKLKSLLSLS